MRFSLRSTSMQRLRTAVNSHARTAGSSDGAVAPSSRRQRTSCTASSAADSSWRIDRAYARKRGRCDSADATASGGGAAASLMAGSFEMALLRASAWETGEPPPILVLHRIFIAATVPLPVPDGRRVRIAVIGASPCERCFAACCRRTVSEFAVLLDGDAERRRFASWSITLRVADEAGTVRHERVIPYRDERCPFLGDDDRCAIYDDRPAACRDFECTRHFDPRRGHGLFLRANQDVARLLEDA